MSSLAKNIAQCEVGQGRLAIFWLGQAGFVFKSSANRVVYIDPYFSDVVERVVGFKRMTACPIPAEDAQAELIICTHEHLDHMDTDALPVLARNPQTHFAGPVECVKQLTKLGVPAGRCHQLEAGRTLSLDAVKVYAVYADHGELAPDAVGVVADFGGIKVYHTGDTAYRPEEFRAAIELQPDILIPCINGKYGNMDAHEAALLTALAAPQLVIPSHFGMFAEHNGDPAAFLTHCRNLAPSVTATVLKVGQKFMFEKQS